MATPRRGEVWLIDFGMAGKTRPALVVSGAFGDQDRALITVTPHTTSLRGSAFEVAGGADLLSKVCGSSGLVSGWDEPRT
ncbi:MAG TPA: type II toxin-antitoxin system PemK/MazF family toxin [Terriglobia bacterium]|nr:type II toxin-antitoxin system PemK/MazF family toxin [Terriglobia bacterium]